MAWDLSDVPVYDAKARCVPQSGHRLEKPEPRTRTKARKDRDDAKQLKAFRLAVWAREMAKTADVLGEDWDFALCQNCLRGVWPDSEPRGEVHHRIGRRAKATRYDPANGVLLCGGPNGCHGKAQRHEITV